MVWRIFEFTLLFNNVSIPERISVLGMVYFVGYRIYWGCWTGTRLCRMEVPKGWFSMNFSHQRSLDISSAECLLRVNILCNGGRSRWLQIWQVLPLRDFFQARSLYNSNLLLWYNLLSFPISPKLQAVLAGFFLRWGMSNHILVR